MFVADDAAVALVVSATGAAYTMLSGVEGFFQKRIMPRSRLKIAVPEKSARSLYVRMFPADLLRRLNWVAEFIGMERDAFVTELLEQDMRRFETSQAESSEWWKTRILVDSEKSEHWNIPVQPD